MTYKQLIKENNVGKMKYLKDEFKNLDESHKKCMICLEEFKENDICRIILCTHRFHDKCIQKWFDRKVKCPICNANMEKLKNKQ